MLLIIFILLLVGGIVTIWIDIGICLHNFCTDDKLTFSQHIANYGSEDVTNSTNGSGQYLLGCARIAADALCVFSN